MELENPELEQPVGNKSPLKEMIVNYIGHQLLPENGDVTVAMAIEVFSAEFPEFLLAIAEENFLRGYQQAVHDIVPMSTESTESTEENA